MFEGAPLQHQPVRMKPILPEKEGLFDEQAEIAPGESGMISKQLVRKNQGSPHESVRTFQGEVPQAGSWSGGGIQTG
jgi:hypothetical protein